MLRSKLSSAAGYIIILIDPFLTINTIIATRAWYPPALLHDLASHRVKDIECLGIMLRTWNHRRPAFSVLLYATAVFGNQGPAFTNQCLVTHIIQSFLLHQTTCWNTTRPMRQSFFAWNSYRYLEIQTVGFTSAVNHTCQMGTPIWWACSWKSLESLQDSLANLIVLNNSGMEEMLDILINNGYFASDPKRSRFHHKFLKCRRSSLQIGLI